MTGVPQDTRSKTERRYRGRFAPSPTGPLHFGSLIAATASYLQAMAADGEWLVRIEDIDPPREVPEAADQIITSLRAHGFRWSGQVCYQSQNIERFQLAEQHLLDAGHAYHCLCSRQQIRAVAELGPLGPVYPGTCRRLPDRAHGRPSAIRVRTDNRPVVIQDRLQGEVCSRLEDEVGDFVIRRKDGLVSYALAAAVDDGSQGITEVVRGADLLGFTPAQTYLMRLLELPVPNYMHIPIAVDPAGEKLSKQTGAPPVDDRQAAENLRRCLTFLGQDLHPAQARISLDELWKWAIDHWRPERLKRCRSRPIAQLKLT
jgi:glutamyl-Q tRNA(Asp) synthetase